MHALLNTDCLQTAVKELGKKIPEFNKIIIQFGIPPLWDRAPGFSTLLYIILEQQVSLASAKATFEKLSDKMGLIYPKGFLKLSDKELKNVGFSWQKAKYCRIVAQEIIDNHLDLELLNTLDDRKVKKQLMSIKGIGHWTSDIYLLMVLLRPDVWPHGDRALAVAAYEVFNLREIPDYNVLQKMAKSWKPWRSVAARILWHYYLNTPRKK